MVIIVIGIIGSQDVLATSGRILYVDNNVSDISQSSEDSVREEGSKEFPYRTIREGIGHMQPGDTLAIRYGTYQEKIEWNISGKKDAPITLMGIPDAQGNLPIITQDDSNRDALLHIDNQSHIIIKNLHFTGNNRGDTPMGIYVEGHGQGYRFSHIIISEIRSNDNAHGMAFYGTDGDAPLEDIIVKDSSIYDCVLGSSEALVFNGNVSHFLVEDNQIYNNDNIGIDCIGFEGTAPYNDQARSGVIRGNELHHITSTTNAAYNFEGSAGGIYVDGGKNILIENNTVTDSDIGIEVASEHEGKVTDGVQVIGNQVAYNTLYGIALGGASTENGFADNNSVKDNVLVANAVDIAIQQARNNRLSRNMIYTTKEPYEGNIEGQTMVDNTWLTPDHALDAGTLLQEAGMIQGNNGSLLRIKSMTREELVMVIWRLRGKPEGVEETNAFDDVPPNHWAAKVIGWAKAEEITLGIGDNQFGLGEPVTGRQVQLFLERTLQLETSASAFNMSDAKAMDVTLRGDIFDRIAIAIGESDNPYQSIDNQYYKYFQVMALLSRAS